MKQLGISIYPEHSTPEKDKAYIKMASQYGFRRIFTCLLSVDGNKEEIMNRFKEIIHFANDLGMQVILDVAPPVLRKLNVSYDDLSFFHELGAYGIRLDLGFTGHEEAAMTCNPYGLKIEINMSQGTRYVDQILSCQPNRDNLWGCHNFYPHRYSGLSYDFFVKCSQQFKDLGIRTAAFVNSHSATFGPWPVMEGLCTLEMHRELPIDVQAKHLFATGLIDDVIIANAYASEEELKALSQVDREVITFHVELSEDITDLERKIVLEETHFYRGDVSDYLIRSTRSRVKYKAESFPPHNTVDMKKGDLLIDNELYGQYKGELQIALQPMKNSGKTNVVGKIVDDEVFLLKYLKPWSKFKFAVKE
ncbi:DUF871 domain-containing protein [Thermoflavimicrobium dichotomicum]|uniref:Outer surface protein n=1 Tax=Thermoflavimicrobium dichotomicum TaxID=46223 RepID=A0A1I3U1B2_9BACL|nr:DUF871 domain-containing protein [Thermoflavimicrobium dichotomicum]SFJ75561.1 hypothetical protein SAMN05421852_12035 [Thermoflavimicrobium dichotomicum]